MKKLQPIFLIPLIVVFLISYLGFHINSVIDDTKKYENENPNSKGVFVNVSSLSNNATGNFEPPALSNITIPKSSGSSGGGSGGGSSPQPSTQEEPQQDSISESEYSAYPIHENITSTIFWVGEPATGENGYISNSQSAWDENWEENFGGFDDPENRDGFYPKDFVPNENPFYFALPYDDIDENGKRKSSLKQVPWFGQPGTSEYGSILKNRWVKIIHGNLTVYAQWEDVGPFETDDFSYVFNNTLPTNQFNSRAGIDVSPAARDFLGLEDIDKVDWEFVDYENVPDGPWKDIVTY